MNALTLSQNYVLAVALPDLQRSFPACLPHLAIGLAGNGSECFGFDDLLSRDHDWGVDFYLWADHELSDMLPHLEQWKAELFAAHPPEFPRISTAFGAAPQVMLGAEFFRTLIGRPDCPDSIRAWLSIPEENLAMAVNGAVFFDGSGRFTDVREQLRAFYPEELRLKKLSAHCMAIAQTGQYNYARTAQRGDLVTVISILTRFTEHVIAMVFLLNRTYRPYYKWAFPAMTSLPLLGPEMADLLRQLANCAGLGPEALRRREELIFSITDTLCACLRREGLTTSEDWFLESHGRQLYDRLTDPFLRSLPIYH